MNNPIIYQVVIGLFSLFFLFLVFMFTKTWRWFTVVCAFFVFCAAVTFCVYAAMSHRTHMAWRAQEAKNRAQAEKLEAEYELLLRGDLSKYVQERRTINALNAEFSRTIFDRGRVWRECTPQAPAADDTVTVSTVRPGAEATPNQIVAQTILYAFAEAEAPAEVSLPAGSKLPVFYLGEFSATAVTDNSVTLTPTIPLDGIQKNALRQAGATWALFEIMPVDGHNYFAQDPAARANWSESADEQPIFGQMDAEFLSKLIPPPPRYPNQSDESYQQMLQAHQVVLDSYVRDGKRALDTDLPEYTWIKVRFTADKEIDVDSAATLGGVTESQKFFDRGLAEIPMLQRRSMSTDPNQPAEDNPAKFKTDDLGIFPAEAANSLIAEGVCERIEPIYVRPLNDYEYAFRAVYHRMVRLQDDQRRTERNTGQLNEALQRNLTQIAFREEEKRKLQEDLGKFTYEREQVTTYLAALEKAVSDTKAELSRLYRTNSQLEQELVQTSDKWTDEINRRTAEAVSSVNRDEG